MSQIKFVLFKSNKTTTDGKKFTAYSTNMNLIVKGEEEKGLQTKKIDVKFDKSLLGRIDEIKGRGDLICDAQDVNAPSIFQVTEKKDKDGKIVLGKDGKAKKVYPNVYISNYIEYRFNPRKATQSAFVTCEDLDGEEVVVDNEEE